MIMIFGTLVVNVDTATTFFHFCETFIFWAVQGVKVLKIAENEKVTVTSDKCHISGTV